MILAPPAGASTAAGSWLWLGVHHAGQQCSTAPHAQHAHETAASALGAAAGELDHQHHLVEHHNTAQCTAVGVGTSGGNLS